MYSVVTFLLTIVSLGISVFEAFGMDTMSTLFIIFKIIVFIISNLLYLAYNIYSEP
jgi:hypothetical protein